MNTYIEKESVAAAKTAISFAPTLTASFNPIKLGTRTG